MQEPRLRDAGALDNASPASSWAGLTQVNRDEGPASVAGRAVEKSVQDRASVQVGQAVPDLQAMEPPCGYCVAASPNGKRGFENQQRMEEAEKNAWLQGKCNERRALHPPLDLQPAGINPAAGLWFTDE